MLLSVGGQFTHPEIQDDSPMSATTPRRTPGPPWLLPVLLALIIVVIILGVIFGSRIKNAVSSPTATPAVTRVVVTATPASSTAAPAGNAAIFPSATPSNGQGVVTPLPHSTPISTVTGLQLDMIATAQHVVTHIQSQADAGAAAYQFYLNPVSVVQNDLPAYGFTKGFQITSPAASPSPTPYTSPDGRPVVKVDIRYQGTTYTVFVGQPSTRGAKGIWLILSILPGTQ